MIALMALIAALLALILGALAILIFQSERLIAEIGGVTKALFHLLKDGADR